MLTIIVDRLMGLCSGWPAWLPLVVIASAAGVLMAVVVRYTSRQDLLRRDAELIQAQLLAMKLFKDDFGTQVGSLGRLLLHIGRRLWHTLPPILVMAIPFTLLLAQLARWYEHLPLAPGDAAVVQLQLSNDAWSKWQQVALEPADGIVLETPPLRDPAEHAIYWRIRVADSLPAQLTWKLADQSVTKTVAVAPARTVPRSVDGRRPGAGFWDRLLYPGEPGLPGDSPVRAIVVQHPDRSTPILGFDIPWWVTFVLVSIFAAVLVRPLVRVQF
jgi:hypothetical protein